MSVLGNLSPDWLGEVLGTASQMPSPNVISQYYASSQNQLASSQVNRSPAPVIMVSVSHAKLDSQIAELVRQIPMSIAASISSCAYYEQDKTEAARFVIMFANTRTLTFYDVDNFPSAEHIGRIALECP